MTTLNLNDREAAERDSMLERLSPGAVGREHEGSFGASEGIADDLPIGHGRVPFIPGIGDEEPPGEKFRPEPPLAAPATPTIGVAREELGAFEPEGPEGPSFSDALFARWRTRNTGVAMQRQLSAEHEAEHGTPLIPITWDKAYIDEVWERWGGENGVPDDMRQTYLEHVMVGRSNEEVNARSQSFMRSLEDRRLLEDESLLQGVGTGIVNMLTDPVTAAEAVFLWSVTGVKQLAAAAGGIIGLEQAIISADDPVQTNVDTVVAAAAATTMGAGIGFIGQGLGRRAAKKLDAELRAHVETEVPKPTTTVPSQSKVAARGKAHDNPVAAKPEAPTGKPATAPARAVDEELTELVDDFTPTSLLDEGDEADQAVLAMQRHEATEAVEAVEVTKLKATLGDAIDDAEEALLHPKTIKLADLKTAAERLGVELPEGCK
jgi:hypothetical protein